jgi:hypothetical protein
MYCVLLKRCMRKNKNKKALVKKYSGSHRELRPTGTEYEINDDQLRNLSEACELV